MRIPLHQIHYKRDLLLAIILSEALCISAFLLSPNTSFNKKIVNQSDPIILIEVIPPTIQSRNFNKTRPENPIIYITEEIEAFEMLDDVKISTAVVEDDEIGTSQDISSMKADYLSSSPRLILEVMPDNNEIKAEGSLNLYLKINTKGAVISHKILFNSLECSDCLDKIIRAAYGSRWEPAIMNGIKIDYWVEKSYEFK